MLEGVVVALQALVYRRQVVRGLVFLNYRNRMLAPNQKMVALLLDSKINITERSGRMELEEEEVEEKEEEKNKVHQRELGGGMDG